MLRQEVAQPGFELQAGVLARPERGLLATVADYVALTKPRIIVLLLVTTLPAMIIAHDGMPSPWLVLLTLVGGAAGAMPPLVGWAAVTGGLDWPALALFAIIFLWTPPHFWALALRYRSDYARAGVPMLPVVRGEEETNRQILLYSLPLVAASLTLVPLAGMGPLYLAAAVALGGGFVALAFRLWRHPRPQASRALFLYSLLYLALLFAAMGIDRLVA